MILSPVLPFSLLSLLFAQVLSLPVDDLRNETTTQFAHRRLKDDVLCDSSNSAHWSLTLTTSAGAKTGTLSGCHSKTCMPIFENVANFDDEIHRGTVGIAAASFANSTDDAGQHGMGTKQVFLFEKQYCQHDKHTARLRQGQNVEFPRKRIFRSYMVTNAGLYWTSGGSGDHDVGMGMTENTPDGEEWWEDIKQELGEQSPMV